MQAQAIRLKIIGRVQGVGFRWFVMEGAKKLGVRGWVKNCTDGSVMVHAEAEAKILETFIDLCKRGPSYARVLDCMQEIAELKNFQEFSIIN